MGAHRHHKVNAVSHLKTCELDCDGRNKQDSDTYPCGLIIHPTRCQFAIAKLSNPLSGDLFNRLLRHPREDHIHPHTSQLIQIPDRHDIAKKYFPST